MPNRVLIRPDGSRLRVGDADAEKLLTLGYREEQGSEALSRDIAAGYEEHYTTPGQKALTALEGLASGATVGLIDPLLEDEATQERARYNPGLRLGTELVGGIAAPGLGELKATAKIAKYLPSAMLSAKAAQVGEKVGRGSKILGTMARGAVEGAGIGAGQAITSATLTGDPVTAESVMAGMGWGAVWGGGLAGLGGGIANRMEARAARKAEREAERLAAPTRAEIVAESNLQRAQGDAHIQKFVKEGLEEHNAAQRALEEANYTHVREAVQDAVGQIKVAGKVADDAMLDFKKLNHSQTKIYNQLVNDPAMFSMTRAEAKAFEKQYIAAKAAAQAGDYEKMVNHLTKFKEHMVAVEQKVAPFFSAEKVLGQADELIGHAQLRVEQATKAVQDVTQMEAIRASLSRFPKTAEEFIALKPKTVEEISAAVDSLHKLKSAEMAGVQAAVGDAVQALSGNLGVKVEGSVGQQIGALHRVVKEARSARGKEIISAARQGERVWEQVRKREDALGLARGNHDYAKMKESASPTGGRAPWAVRHIAGSWASQKLGPVGYVLGSSLVSGLVGLKGAILGAITEKANKWVPKAARGVEKYSARVEPLAMRLDGMEDEKKSREELLRRRAKEITEAAPAVRDTLYRSLEPLAIGHPELAVALHKHGVARFQFLLEKMPKDPGLAFSNLKSLWKPDPIAAEKFARYYEVFHDPVSVMTRALATGKITMEAADGLKNMNPELYSYMRAAMLYRVADPEVLGKMKYADQVHLGMLLDIPMHSTMDPRFIVAQQQMYTERNQPLEMNPRIQPGGGAGRPSGPGPNATSAQRITEH